MSLKNILKTNQKYEDILKLNGINDLKSFFEYFPRNYEDRTNLTNLNSLKFDNSVQSVKGKIISKTIIDTKTGKKLIQMKFQDENGLIGNITFMNSKYIFNSTQINNWYIIMGKPKLDRSKVVFWYPELILSQQDEDGDDNEYKVGRIYPIYSEMLGISHNWFAKKIWENLSSIDDLFIEFLPLDYLEKYDLLDLKETIKNIHFPKNNELLNKARYRIFFQRLLKIQLISLINRIQYQNSSNIVTTQMDIDRNLIKDFLKDLPFELTNSQKKSLKQIIENFYSSKPMLRLLQGDVGSGKTIVAVASAYYIIKKFYGQVALVAPTEVLANQHLLSIGKILLPKGIRIELLTGSTTGKQKEKIKDDLVNGKINLIIGTHAILQEDVFFQDLKLAIIDEQHKFGVLQRAFFKKFNSPHLLQMTATPIPRSMALAFFGEFDFSIINQMPIGRKEIITKVFSNKEYLKYKQWFITKLNQGQKIYVITPLIQESEKMDELKSAIQEYDEIKKIFFEYNNNIGLLHGKMKPKEKDEVMSKFKKGEYKILVSTTVIEVGIDVSDATIIIIKNSERFGLSQLHQLRGRVGRSDLQSYCFLETEKTNSDSYKRLKYMEEIKDGFKLAELDLKMRGSGEILGTKQSGYTDIPPEILGDINFLEKIQESANRLLENYTNLDGLDNLKNYLFQDGENLLV